MWKVAWVGEDMEWRMKKGGCGGHERGDVDGCRQDTWMGRMCVWEGQVKFLMLITISKFGDS